jgi:hypothetical protein
MTAESNDGPSNDGPYRESTKPLLRPHQVESLKVDEARIEATLNAPEYIRRGIQDKGALLKQLQSVKRDLEGSVPAPYAVDRLDSAMHRHDELLEEIRAGMPTQAEMRRRPPGAVDKHMGWERRNKEKILELKNIRLRMHQSGMLDAGDGSEVANIERFRPAGGTSELAMDGALIQGKNFFMPDRVTPAAVMTESDEAVLREHDPDLLSQMALLDNESRAKVLGLVRELAKVAPEEKAPKTAGPGKKRKGKAKKDGRRKINVSPETRAYRAAHMRALNEAKRAAKSHAEAHSSGPGAQT